MKPTFKECLERKRIFRFHPARHLFDLELEDADYRRKFSQEGASATVIAAERFLKETRDILEKK